MGLDCGLGVNHVFFLVKKVLLNLERSRFNLYKKLEIPGWNPWDPIGDPPGEPKGYKYY